MRQANERQRWMLHVEQLLVKRVDALRRRRREQTRPFQERKRVAVAGAPHNRVNLHRQTKTIGHRAPLEPLRVTTAVNITLANIRQYSYVQVNVQHHDGPHVRTPHKKFQAALLQESTGIIPLGTQAPFEERGKKNLRANNKASHHGDITIPHEPLRYEVESRASSHHPCTPSATKRVSIKGKKAPCIYRPFHTRNAAPVTIDAPQLTEVVAHTRAAYHPRRKSGVNRLLLRILCARQTVCATAMSEERGSVMRMNVHWLPRAVRGKRRKKIKHKK